MFLSVDHRAHWLRVSPEEKDAPPVSTILELRQNPPNAHEAPHIAKHFCSISYAPHKASANLKTHDTPRMEYLYIPRFTPCSTIKMYR